MASTNSKRTSQRQNGFKGGIQAGATAFDPSSLMLDIQVKTISQHLARYYCKSKGLKHRVKMPNNFIDTDFRVGCQPDGGIFFNSDGTIECVFEAKKQGWGGNAIERFFKNHFFLGYIGRARSISFGIGKGVDEGGIIYRLWGAVLVIEQKKNQFNVVHKNGSSFFISVDGFRSDYIRAVMIEALEIDETTEEKTVFDNEIKQEILEKARSKLK